jgi:hypothetical protein
MEENWHKKPHCFWQIQEDTNIEILQQIMTSHPKVVIAVLGVVTLFLAMKFGRVILKLVFGLVGLAVIVGGVWWFGFNH